MRTPLAITAALLFLAACTSALQGGNSYSSSASVSSAAMLSSSSVASATALDATYTDNDLVFTVRYPSAWKVVQGDKINTDDYEATGTSIFYPADTDASTLNEAKFSVAVVPTCPVLANTQQVMVGGLPYTLASWNGAAAGNLYQGETYTAPHGDGCAVITFYFHSCNLGADCGDGHTTAFDRDRIVSVMRDMLGSLTWTK